MSRRRNIIPNDQFYVFVPKLLSDRLRIICTDPTTGRLEHGKRSKIISGLVAEMLYKSNLLNASELKTVTEELEK